MFRVGSGCSGWGSGFYRHPSQGNTLIVTVLRPIFTLFTLHISRIVGDNIDFEVRARVQDKEHGNRSIHWTHPDSSPVVI